MHSQRDLPTLPASLKPAPTTHGTSPDPMDGEPLGWSGTVATDEEGWIIEVAEMFDVLRQMAAGPWRRYLEYSGGSRLDQEFLIKVKAELISAVEAELGIRRSSS